MIKAAGYENRSEAIRDLIRDKLTEQKVKNPKAQAVATVMLVYDHHHTQLSTKLLKLQHNHLLKTISAIHVHINPHDCLEVIILKGKAGEIEQMAKSIISLKGVKLGRLNFIAV